MNRQTSIELCCYSIELVGPNLEDDSWALARGHLCGTALNGSRDQLSESRVPGNIASEVENKH